MNMGERPAKRAKVPSGAAADGYRFSADFLVRQTTLSLPSPWTPAAIQSNRLGLHVSSTVH